MKDKQPTEDSAYPRPGSNRHAFKGQGILSPSCLPIPPLRHLHKKSRFHSGPCRAENETRTRDPDLGKVVLYQLSYFRKSGAENETRTRDPDLGKVVLYQLSYFRLRIAPQKYNFFLFCKYFCENFYLFSNFLISFNFIKASTGVSVSMLVFKMSSLICNNNGSSN